MILRLEGRIDANNALEWEKKLLAEAGRIRILFWTLKN